MAESWDSGTRLTVQKLPLLTVRERGTQKKDREWKWWRDNERERSNECFSLSTPTERDKKEKKFHLSKVRAGPRDAKEEWEKRLKEVKKTEGGEKRVKERTQKAVSFFVSFFLREKNVLKNPKKKQITF